MLREKKVWFATLPCTISAAILMLGARATPAIAAIAAIPAIVAAMGAIVVAGVPDIRANAGVTQAQIDASRVLFDKHTIREEKVYTMILLTLEQGDVISLLDFP